MARAAAKKTSRSKAVAPRNTAAVIPIGDGEVPDYLRQGTGRGSENVGTEDLVIPRLEVIQGLSPAVKRGDPGYIEGAEMGMLNNSVSRELYGDSVLVIPVYYEMLWLVWRERKTTEGKPQEGGFFGAYKDQGEADDRRQLEENAGGNNIVVIDTPTHLCKLVKPDGKLEDIMISMPRTKAKISRQWNSMIMMAGGDRFSRVYQIGSDLQKNAQGDFYNFSIKPAGFVSEDAYKACLEFYDKIAQGSVRATMDTSDLNTGTSGSDPADSNEY